MYPPVAAEKMRNENNNGKNENRKKKRENEFCVVLFFPSTLTHSARIHLNISIFACDNVRVELKLTHVFFTDVSYARRTHTNTNASDSCRLSSMCECIVYFVRLLTSATTRHFIYYCANTIEWMHENVAENTYIRTHESTYGLRQGHV